MPCDGLSHLFNSGLHVPWVEQRGGHDDDPHGPRLMKKIRLDRHVACNINRCATQCATRGKAQDAVLKSFGSILNLTAVLQLLILLSLLLSVLLSAGQEAGKGRSLSPFCAFLLTHS